MVSRFAPVRVNAFRSSQRLTVTLPHGTFEGLMKRSLEEGRSLSNLAAYLLESALEQRAAALSSAAPRPAAR